MKTITTKIFGETVALRANWAEAGCPIEQMDCDGEWGPMDGGYQVADFRCRPEDALRHALHRMIRESGDAPEDFRDEVIDAIKSAAEE